MINRKIPEKLPEIKSVIVVTQQGSGSHYIVGEDGVTDIFLDCRQISQDIIVNNIIVKKENNIISEISMLTPYVITFKNNK